MGTRLQLHELLQGILTSCNPNWSGNLYFQHPSTVTMKYPCILYSKNNIKIESADNNPYMIVRQYQITVVDSNPDSLIPDKIAMLPKCTFVTHYTKDNLNHDIFNLYY